jgi:hypothetical protein
MPNTNRALYHPTSNRALYAGLAAKTNRAIYSGRSNVLDPYDYELEDWHYNKTGIDATAADAWSAMVAASWVVANSTSSVMGRVQKTSSSPAEWTAMASVIVLDMRNFAGMKLTSFVFEAFNFAGGGDGLVTLSTGSTALPSDTWSNYDGPPSLTVTSNGQKTLTPAADFILDDYLYIAVKTDGYASWDGFFEFLYSGESITLA